MKTYSFSEDTVLFSRHSFMSYLKNRTRCIFLLLLLLSPLLTCCSNSNSNRSASSGATRSNPSATAPPPSPSATVNLPPSIGTSQFSPGITLVDNTINYPWGDNDLAAVNRVKSLIKNAIPYENTPIMAWGVDDPWPDPSQQEPGNWSSLDTRMQLIMETGGIPVISLAEAPWWMKGVLQADGTTRLITRSEEWSDIAYKARILDNKMAAWLHLVQRVAERYMAAPYNVRYFQVWNELKGYYDPITNAYDYSASPGNPSLPSARHGYTYMYNLVYTRLMQVAESLRIPTSSIKVGGPYVVIDTWSSRNQSTASTITTAYGTYDQRSLDVVQYWLQHKAGAGFITLDSSNSNKDNVNITNPFTAAEKFADMVQWIRSLDSTVYPDAATLPIWWAEWYASPYTKTTDANYNDAIKSYAMIKLIKAGGAVALSWGGLGDGPPGTGLWTTTTAGGGQALPWYYSLKDFKDYFAPGTKLYRITVSIPESVEALASATKIMLVNKTAHSITVTVNGVAVSLSPYQVYLMTQVE